MTISSCRNIPTEFVQNLKQHAVLNSTSVRVAVAKSWPQSLFDQVDVYSLDVVPMYQIFCDPTEGRVERALVIRPQGV